MTVLATNLWYFFQRKNKLGSIPTVTTQLLHPTISQEQLTMKASARTLLWGEGREPVTFSALSELALT